MPYIAKRARKGLRQRKTPPGVSPVITPTPTESTLPVFEQMPLNPNPFAPVPRPDIPVYKHACHLENIIPRLKADETIRWAVKTLTPETFDTIAVRGVSGLLIGPLLAHLMQKELIVVRKPYSEERNASGLLFEGHATARRYIIVDDLIDLYSTAVQIHRQVKRSAPGAELVGILLYQLKQFSGLESDRLKAILEKSAGTFVPRR